MRDISPLLERVSLARGSAIHEADLDGPHQVEWAKIAVHLLEHIWSLHPVSPDDVRMRKWRIDLWREWLVRWEVARRREEERRW